MRSSMEPITLSVSTKRMATLALPVAASAFCITGVDVTAVKRLAIAAVELIKKLRLFIRDFRYWALTRNKYIFSRPFLPPLRHGPTCAAQMSDMLDELSVDVGRDGLPETSHRNRIFLVSRLSQRCFERHEDKRGFRSMLYGIVNWLRPSVAASSHAGPFDVIDL